MSPLPGLVVPPVEGTLSLASGDSVWPLLRVPSSKFQAGSTPCNLKPLVLIKSDRDCAKCCLPPFSSKSLQLNNKFQALDNGHAPSPVWYQLGDHPSSLLVSAFELVGDLALNRRSSASRTARGQLGSYDKSTAYPDCPAATLFNLLSTPPPVRVCAPLAWLLLLLRLSSAVTLALLPPSKLDCGPTCSL